MRPSFFFFAVPFLISLASAFGADPEVTARPPAIRELPGIQYKSVNIQLGGFLASDTVYRSHNMASDIGTPFHRVPFSNGAGHGMAEFRGTERASRFSLLAQSDPEVDLRLSGYYELDFLGTTPTANPNESNSYSPRTRNVYATIDTGSGWHFLGGQSWTLLTLHQKGILPRAEFLPQTIDSQGAVGFDWARQWQLRVAKEWRKLFWTSISFENAQTAGLGGKAATGTGNTWQLPAGSAMSSNLSFDAWPDVILKLAWDPGFGHYEIFNLARNFEGRYGGTTVSTQSSRQSLWTEAAGGGGILPVLPSRLDFAASFLVGRGIGRYGTSTLPDATYASDGSLNPLSGHHYLVALAWHISKDWEAYFAYGHEELEAAPGAPNFGYGDGVVADNSGCTALGGTCDPNVKSTSQENAALWWSFYRGDFGTAKLGVQYSHTELNTYADANGFAPATSLDMAFTSLRFYPF